MVAPFEDRRLHETVSFQLAAAGASEIPAASGTADLDLTSSRPGTMMACPRRSPRASHATSRQAVAPSSPTWTRRAMSRVLRRCSPTRCSAQVFRSLFGYASWNTAGNTLGTAIPHGLLVWAGARLAMRCSSPAFTALAAAQATFLIDRLVNDYAYQGVLRPVVNRELRQAGRDALWLKSHVPEVEVRIQEALAPTMAEYARQFSPTYVLPSPGPTDVVVQVGDPRNLQVRLPWGRTFEAAITFDVPVKALGDGRLPPSPGLRRAGGEASRPTPGLPTCTPTSK